jgi:hypothetical protein
MNSLVCPHCNSKSIFYSSELVKAQIDKAQTSELLNIIEKKELFYKSILLTAKINLTK